MRITLSMLTSRIRANLENSASGMLEAQERVVSGKRIQRPSDDVAGVGRAMSLRATLASVDQYDRNSNILESHLFVTSDALTSITSKLQDVRNLVLRAASEAVTAEARAGIVTQLDQISDELAAVANKQHLGRYIFSGSASDTKPLLATGGDPPYSYQGNGDSFSIQVAPGTFLAANVTGDAVFNLGGAAVPGEPDVFATINALKQKVLAGDVAGMSAELTHIDANLLNVTTIRSQIGGRLNRLESANDALLDSKVQLQDLLSKTEDADFAESVIDLRTRENVYQAALETASRVMQISLGDFLK